MLYVKTKIGPSTVHGTGLFADQFIPKGTTIWEYSPEFDTGYTEEQLSRMSEPARKIFLWYAYYDFNRQKYILCFDDQRFINHSIAKHNVITTPDKDVALRDIQAGEEILCIYDDFDKEYWKRLGVDPTVLSN